MKIESLKLKDFRNFEDERLDFGPAFNLLVGRNAQGKTNVIEALGLLATGHSFRTSEFRDMIRHESESSDVRSRATGAAGSDDLQVTLDVQRKGFFRNAKKTTPGGFKGLSAVLFAPEEILLLRDSPSARRRYLDVLIAQAEPRYRTLVRSYERVVSHRNRLLQEIAATGRGAAALLRSWDEQLAELGARIVVARAAWCGKLNGFIPGRYAAIAPQDGQALFRYRPHCGDAAVAGGEPGVQAAMTEGLEQRRQDEIDRGFTLVGPHRDDLEAAIGDAAIKSFGSQGQHRTFVLALKIAEIDLLREVLGETPILLLDDVASELDRDRNRFFFDYLSEAKGQVFVTATDADAIRIAGEAKVRRFTIDAGRATSS